MTKLLSLLALCAFALVGCIAEQKTPTPEGEQADAGQIQPPAPNNRPDAGPPSNQPSPEPAPEMDPPEPPAPPADPMWPCSHNDDCDGSPWGPICVIERGDDTGLCQECQQAENGSAAQGCGGDTNSGCSWGISRTSRDGSTMTPENRSVYWCSTCNGASCGPGLACSHREDRCLPDQNGNHIPDVEERHHWIDATFVAVGMEIIPPIPGSHPHWDGLGADLEYLIAEIVCYDEDGEMVQRGWAQHHIDPDPANEYDVNIGLTDAQWERVQLPCAARVSMHIGTYPEYASPYYEHLEGQQRLIRLGRVRSRIGDAPFEERPVGDAPEDPAFLVR